MYDHHTYHETYPPYVYDTWVATAEPVDTFDPVEQDGIGYVAPDDVGWTALLEGRLEEAVRQFGAASRAQPQSGEPRVGYALASAASDHFERAVRAMRYAFWLDPDGVRELIFDDALDPLVRTLSTRFAFMAADEIDEADAAFMVGALHYLLRENEAAHEAVTLLIRTGDRKPGTSNLVDLISAERPRKPDPPILGAAASEQRAAETSIDSANDDLKTHTE